MDRKTRTVTMSLSEIIDSEGLEGFLDLIEDLFFAEDDEEHRGILSDIHYKLIGSSEDSEGETVALVEVSGYVEGVYDDEGKDD